MATITGVNNPRNGLHVDKDGRAETHAVNLPESTRVSIDGDAYNVNTGNITLTNATETPIFYLKNDTDERSYVIPRVFISFAASTGGSGSVNARILFNPTSGTIITGTAITPANFNASSSKTLNSVATKGATGSTAVGTNYPVQFLFPKGAPDRHLIQFEPGIILQRGSSMVLLLTPPAGNTSMVVQAGCNVYLEIEE